MQPSERLEEFLKYKKWSYDHFAKEIGISLSGSDKYVGKGDKSTYSSKILQKLSKVGLNLNWYLTGEGEMLLSESTEKIIPSLHAGTIEGPNNLNRNIVNDILDIKLYNIPVHANRGALVQFEDLAYSYKPIHVGLKLDPNKCIGLSVVGDSMIDSQITDGSIIVVEKDTNLNDGDRAVINHNGTLIVKYYRDCSKCELEECQECKFKFKLYSRNHGEHPYELSPDDYVEIIGKVKLVIQY